MQRPRLAIEAMTERELWDRLLQDLGLLDNFYRHGIEHKRPRSALIAEAKDIAIRLRSSGSQMFLEDVR